MEQVGEGGRGDDKHPFPRDIVLPLRGMCASFFFLLLLFLIYSDSFVYRMCRNLTTPIRIQRTSLPSWSCLSHGTRVDLLKIYIRWCQLLGQNPAVAPITLRLTALRGLAHLPFQPPPACLPAHQTPATLSSSFLPQALLFSPRGLYTSCFLCLECYFSWSKYDRITEIRCSLTTRSKIVTHSSFLFCF